MEIGNLIPSKIPLGRTGVNIDLFQAVDSFTSWARSTPSVEKNKQVDRVLKGIVFAGIVSFIALSIRN